MPAAAPVGLPRPTLVDRLVELLARAILRGELAPGSRLPPIRRLAAEHGVTVPTAQRAIARLEEMSLVVARQGSGVTVLDPLAHAGPATLPLWVCAVLDDPERATAMLADFLELRRAVALAQLLSVRTVLQDAPPLDPLLVPLERATDAAAAVEADLALTRALLSLQPQVAFASVLNVLERMLRDVIEVQQAMYAVPAENARRYAEALSLLRSRRTDASVRARLESLLQVADDETLRRFRARLERTTPPLQPES